MMGSGFCLPTPSDTIHWSKQYPRPFRRYTFWKDSHSPSATRAMGKPSSWSCFKTSPAPGMKSARWTMPRSSKTWVPSSMMVSPLSVKIIRRLFIVEPFQLQLFRPVAGYKMARLQLLVLRGALLTFFRAEAAAGMEVAARGRIGRVGDLTLQGDPLGLHCGVGHGDGGEQALSV